MPPLCLLPPHSHAARRVPRRRAVAAPSPLWRRRCAPRRASGQRGKNGCLLRGHPASSLPMHTLPMLTLPMHTLPMLTLPMHTLPMLTLPMLTLPSRYRSPPRPSPGSSLALLALLALLAGPPQAHV